eukprot:3480593-Pyramimonas_sp.AAC.1
MIQETPLSTKAVLQHPGDRLLRPRREGRITGRRLHQGHQGKPGEVFRLCSWTVLVPGTSNGTP